MKRVVVLSLLLISGCTTPSSVKEDVVQGLAQIPYFHETDRGSHMFAKCSGHPAGTKAREQCLMEFINFSFANAAVMFNHVDSEYVKNHRTVYGEQMRAECIEDIQKESKEELDKEMLLYLCDSKTTERTFRSIQAEAVANIRWNNHVAQTQAWSNAMSGLSNTVNQINTNQRLQRLENRPTNNPPPPQIEFIRSSPR